MLTESSPITGREDAGDRSRPVQALSEFYRAFNGRERGTLTAADGKTLDLRIRTSRIFRRDSDGQWRQVHHHGSMDDPELLRAYQSAVGSSPSSGSR